MDQRINQITAWYNAHVEQHIGHKREFENRFANEDGQVDLNDPDIARGFGRLEKERQMLDGIGAILSGDVSIEVVQTTDSNIDKT
ncbi:hypothetical protein KC950_03145 [Candidatus Saccharibacteria bacterium]|nr:hypothetical protein [Candidatus Saccharibacteria bacterium]